MMRGRGDPLRNRLIVSRNSPGVHYNFLFVSRLTREVGLISVWRRLHRGMLRQTPHLLSSRIAQGGKNEDELEFGTVVGLAGRLPASGSGPCRAGSGDHGEIGQFRQGSPG